MNSALIITIILLIVGKLSWNHGYKKGKKECEGISYIDGYRNGISCIENEILDLAEQPDDEILKRIKNFYKKESKS